MLVAPRYKEFTYERRVREQELLHRVLVEHLETFLAKTRREDHELPRYVEQELRDYVSCGVLGCGFVRLVCEDCGKEQAVAFSCKGRGFCPSCTGRRMADTAARLVDDVFPSDVPVRQWVLSLPYEIRYRLAYDGKLLSDVLAVFLRVVQAWYEKQARAAGYGNARCGSVTFAQRFGSSLNVNPHYHVLMLDGVYVEAEDAPVFAPAPALADDDVERIVETTARRVLGLLERRGILERDGLDPLVDESPVLAGITAASVHGLVATGERSGALIRRVLSDPLEAIRTGVLCYGSQGFSLHAATRVEPDDRAFLERLCRYVARPPLAAGRLERIDDEKLSFALKTPWDDGTTHLILSPLELLEKLAALVPPPRINLIRYHGVLAPHAKDRDKIVPAGKRKRDEADRAKRSKHRLAWAALLARVFQVDALACDCGGRMRIVAAATDPGSIRRYLEGTGQCADVPTLAAARAPPQAELDFAD
jgi:hypothetical protein